MDSYAYDSVKIALATIPIFDNSNISVYDFLDACDEALMMIDPNFEEVFVKLIRSKLKGEVFRSILGQPFLNYIELKIYLLDTFRSYETIYQLIGIVSNDFQRDNEKVISFSNRLKKLKSQIFNIALCEDKLNSNFKIFIEEMLVECFVRGLKPEIEERIQNNFQNLTDATLFAIKIERNLIIKKNIRENVKDIENLNNNSTKISRNLYAAGDVKYALNNASYTNCEDSNHCESRNKPTFIVRTNINKKPYKIKHSEVNLNKNIEVVTKGVYTSQFQSSNSPKITHNLKPEYSKRTRRKLFFMSNNNGVKSLHNFTNTISSNYCQNEN